jgi:cation diffusion facilitator CzcD-associated flavoprotein CzcO
METHFPYVIIGAGPAGVQLSYFLGKAGLNHILVERSDRASDFFRTYPRHRKLLSINKVHTGIKDSETNLRWDWNSLLSDDYEPLLKERTAKYFPDAASFVDYLGDFVTRHDIEIATEFDVEGIDRNPASRRFEVRARDGRVLTADRLILATGLSLPWVPDIEGIEHAEHYASVSVDPADFVNKRVLIIGKGNSAFETAENLVETAASIHLVSPSPSSFCLANALRGQPSRGQQQLPRHLPAQVAECGPRRHDRRHREGRRRVRRHLRLYPRPRRGRDAAL